MGLGFFYFIGTLFILALVGLAFWIIWIFTREKQDPENETILINFMPQYTSEFSLGTIDSIETSKEMSKITFYPRDLNYIRLNKKEKNLVLKPQVLFVLNKNLLYLPLGSLSGHRNFVFAFPPRAEELPDKLKETKFGRILMDSLASSESNLENERHMRKVIEGIINVRGKELPDKVVQDYLEKFKEMGTSLPSNSTSSSTEKKGGD
jgi:hypothetical protein